MHMGPTGFSWDVSVWGRERRMTSSRGNQSVSVKYGQFMDGSAADPKEATCILPRTADMFCRVMKARVLKGFIWRK